MSGKRLALALTALVALLGLATAASAKAPDKITVTNPTEVDVFPAGTYCDFKLERDQASQVTAFQYYDNNGNPGRVEEHIHVTVVHTNLDTGYVLSEDDVINITDAGAGPKIVGLFFHLRDASGKLVLVQAGQLNVATGKVTPNVDENFRATECAALGGHAV